MKKPSPASLLLTGALALGLTACGGPSEAPQEVLVPQALTSLPRKPATPELGDPCTPLRQAGLTSCEVKQVPSSKLRGALVEQTPAAGTPLAEAGDTIVLSYSEGPPQAAVPVLKGKQPGEAEGLLYGLGFEVVGREEIDATGTSQGKVVGLKDRKEGEVLPKATPVTLLVASGFITVPTFTDLTLKEAQVKAAQAGLRLTPRYLPNPAKKVDYIYLQNPAPGRALLREQVEVTIAVPAEESGATVLDVEGSPLSEGVALLKSQGFRNLKTVETSEERAREGEEVRIVSLTPMPGTRVPNTTEVTLVVEGTYLPEEN